MGYQEHKNKSPHGVTCAILTFSDTRTPDKDESGHYIKQKLKENGHQVKYHGLIKNDTCLIQQEMNNLLSDKEINVIITSGGTGASSRDVVVETITPLLDKKLDGFGELFRHFTYQEIGTASIMSRAMGGISKGKVILCLPGSPSAARLALEKVILPEISHLVREATR